LNIFALDIPPAMDTRAELRNVEGRRNRAVTYEPLRTPDERFDDLPGFPYAPRYINDLTRLRD
jgi:hypothetical protein